MQFIKGLMIAALIAFSSVFFIGVSMPEKAEALCPIGKYPFHGNDGTDPSGTCVSSKLSQQDTDNAQGFSYYLAIIVQTLAGFSLSIAVIAVVYGGYLYVTAGADPKNIQKAKGILISAGIGVFVSLSVFILFRMFASMAGFI